MGWMCSHLVLKCPNPYVGPYKHLGPNAMISVFFKNEGYSGLNIFKTDKAEWNKMPYFVRMDPKK